MGERREKIVTAPHSSVNNINLRFQLPRASQGFAEMNSNSG